MGSSLGLKHFLEKLGHTVDVISPTNWAAFLNWMPGCKTVIDYDLKRTVANQLILVPTGFFALILIPCREQKTWKPAWQRQTVCAF